MLHEQSSMLFTCAPCRSDLLSQVHTHNRQLQEEAQQQRRPATRRGGEQLHVRDANVDLITTMLAALEKEHEFL